MAIITRWRIPPENSVRVLIDAAAGVRDAHEIEQLRRALARRGFADRAVNPHRLDQLPADLELRVQRRQRVLEDHRDLVPADVAQLLLGGGQEVAAVEHDAPR